MLLLIRRIRNVERYGIEPSVDALKPHDALFDIQASIAELAYYHKMGWTL